MVNTTNRTSLFCPSAWRALCLVALAAVAGCSDDKASPNVQSSVNLLVDDFESDPWGSRWDRKDSCAEVDPEAARGGSAGVRMQRACWIRTLPPIRTTGYENVRVAFDYRTANLDPDERVDVLWSLDGESWTLVSRSPEGGVAPYDLGTPEEGTGWARAVVQLPLQTYGQERLFIRIDLAVNGSGDERLDLDNFELEAEPIAACDHAALCEEAQAQCGVIADEVCGDVPCEDPGCGGDLVCVRNRCEAELDCTAETRCAEAQAECGVIFHPTCGDLDCGGLQACEAQGEVCTDNRCEPQCSPAAVCAAAMAQCGSVTDANCGDVECGACPDEGTCDTSGDFNRCIPPCTPLTCEGAGAQCGDVPDGCGGTLNCGGGCEGGLVCGADYACIAPGCEDLPVNATMWFRAEFCNDEGVCADLSGNGYTTASQAGRAPARVVADDSGKPELTYGQGGRHAVEIRNSDGCTGGRPTPCAGAVPVDARTTVVVARKSGTQVAYLDLLDYYHPDGTRDRRNLYFADTRVYYGEIQGYGDVDRKLSSLTTVVPDDELLIITVASSPVGNALYINGALVDQDSEPALPTQLNGVMGFANEQPMGIAEFLSFDHVLSVEARNRLHASLAARYGIEGVGLINVATRGVASQSSTVGDGEASRAIDGDTNGDWGEDSVTHTDIGDGWWEVDLLGEFPIREVVLHNRTDCCSERLRDFVVRILDSGRNEVASRTYMGEAGVRTALPFQTDGRYVRVELSVEEPLSLAEVEVMVPRARRAAALTVPQDGLEAWFRADPTDLTVDPDTDDVTEWRSKLIGGEQHVLRPPAGEASPRFVTAHGPLAGKPVVWFGAGADTSLQDDSLADVFNAGAPFSVIAVVDRGSVVGQDAIFSARDEAGEQVVRWLAYSENVARQTPPASGQSELRSIRKSGDGLEELSSAGDLRVGVPFVLSEVLDGTRAEMRHNGGLVGAAERAVHPADLSKFYIGSDFWNGDAITEWSGAIAELLIFRRALTAVELQRVEQYLASRYGTAQAPEFVRDSAAAWIRSDNCATDGTRCADRSGNGRDAGLVAGHAAPDVVRNLATGQFETQFSSESQTERHALSAGGAPCAPSASEPCSEAPAVDEYTFTVVASTSGTDPYSLFSHNHFADGGAPHRRDLFTSDGRVRFLQAERYGSGDSASAELSGPIAADETYVVTVVASRGGGGTEPGLRLYVNGVLEDQRNDVTVLATQPLGYLGGSAAGPAAIAEMVFLDRPLDTAELADLHSYVGARYGIDVPVASDPSSGVESTALAAGAPVHVACEPLDGSELVALGDYVACSDACLRGRLAARTACLRECPAPAASWDKNLDGVVNAVDLELAQLEAQDQGALELICYEGGAVVPIAACGAGDCRGTRPAETRDADCVDADGDGIWKWQEDLLGTSDDAATGTTAECSETVGCASFDDACRYSLDVNRQLCLPRCGGDAEGCRCQPGDVGCVETAFHLEEVSQDNGELIVHVHFDHAPAPVNVLDLYLDYEASAMTLTDARPLEALRNTDKELSVRHFSDTQLRLVVLGSTNTVPIPTGPIAELVFTRVSSRQTSLGFTGSDFLQQWAAAPDLGEQARLELTEDSRWGNDIEIAAAAPDGPRMLLYYSFDNAQVPRDIADVRSGEELCELSSSAYCLSAVEADTPLEIAERNERVAQYAALQRGVTQYSEPLEGVSGNGARFDGLSDHLQLPVTVAGATDTDGDLLRGEQDFSFSTWLFVDSTRHEGNSPQVVFSHNGANGTAVMSLLATPTSASSFDLQWKVSDISADGDVHQVSSGLEADRWYHVAFTFDEADQGALRRPADLQFFVDGELQMLTLASGDESETLGLEPNQAFVCPQLTGAADTGARLQLAEEGAGTGSSSPDQIFFASALNNLHGIETMDTTGLARRTVYRNPNSSAKDPDYSPVLDKLVYSSNESGEFEIWIANGDGTAARQVTKGFGRTQIGAFARRPKWHPTGNGFVFESNIFDVPNGYNTGRSYQLYYVPMNTETSQVAVQYTPGGTVSNEMEFDQVREEVSDAPGPLRLTPITAVGHHHYRAQWTAGDQDGSGTLICTRAGLRYNDPEVARIEVGGADTQVDSAYPTGYSIVAATKPIGQNTTPNMLLKQQWVEYTEHDQFEVTVSGNEISVRYTPTGYDPFCWDINRNGERDDNDQFTEDLNADGVIDEADCLAHNIDNLYVELFNGVALAPSVDNEDPFRAPAELAEKRLEVRQIDTGDGGQARRFLTIDLFSSTDPTPLADGQVVATIQTTGTETSLAGSVAIRRTAHEEFRLWTGSSDPDCTESCGLLIPFALPGHFEQVLDAAFSPEGDRLVVAVLENSRPVIVVTDRMLDVLGELDGSVFEPAPGDPPELRRLAATSVRKISDAPVAVEGLQWVSVTRTYPCNWVGAFREPSSKRYLHAFRGGLDELKIHSYVRKQAAFRSETERGRERLAISQPDGPDVAGNACGNNFDCPEYQLCVNGSCATQACEPGVYDPEAEGYCHDGACTLMPVSRDPAASEVAWVCSAECSNDNQCFGQQCLNGPCRFCGPGDTCMECRNTTNAFGVMTHEGCPDANSFACVDGSCVTECYVTENGSSEYLCNPGTEYCFQGRCRQFEWTWPDLAPASMVGLGRMGVDGLPETIVKDQLFPIHIWGYGVRDYLHPPEVLVQGRAANSPYGADWFDLGRFLVYHRTEGEATTNAPGQIGQFAMAHTVMTPYELNGLRLLLVQPPYENLANAATGMATLGESDRGGRDSEFCASSAPHSPTDKRACWKLHSGSESVIGYELGIPRWRADQFEACRDGSCGSPPPQFESYLHGGNDAVVITRVAIERDGSTSDVFPVGSTVVNRACTYGNEGDTRSDPVGKAHQPIRRSFESGAQLFDFDVATNAYGLLNCPYANPETGELAKLELGFVFPPESSARSGAVVENANGCLVIKGPGQQVPCFEWVGNAPTLDPFTAPMEFFRTIEVQDFTSFGYDYCDAGNPSAKPPIPPQTRKCPCPGDDDYDALAGEVYSPSGTQSCPPDGSGAWGPCECPNAN